MPPFLRPGRATLATRTLLVRMRCDLETQIRGLLKTFGLILGKAPSRLAKRAHEIVADELADKPEFAGLVETLLAMRADVIERIAGQAPCPSQDDTCVPAVHDRAPPRPAGRVPSGNRMKGLLACHGVGPITALAVWPGIDDAARFARSRDVGAYFGLTP